jgi:hypothetical protein
MLEARNPLRACEDLREAPQGPHGAPVASSTQVEELSESVPEELLASESGGHHGLYLDHGEVLLRVAELWALAAPDSRSIAWDLGQFLSDLTAITQEIEVTVFVSMALVVNAGHMASPEAKKNLMVGGKLAVRPKVQAVWYRLMASTPEGMTATQAAGGAGDRR